MEMINTPKIYALWIGMIIAIIFFLASVAQGEVPSEQWNKEFGGGYAKSGQQTSDGGYILAGGKLYGNGSSDAWLIKTDANGKYQWDKIFGGTNYDYADYVQQTKDGGYIVAGEKGGNATWLIKTDEKGNELWSKTFGEIISQRAYSVHQTIDGGYLFVWNSGGKAYLTKTDLYGSQQWTKTFGEAYMDTVYSFKQTSDDGYILAGSTQPYVAGNTDMWLIKVDTNGNKQWSRTFGEGFARSVQQTSDGGYVIAGSARLLKADENGNELWNKTFSGMFYSIYQTTDGGYILVGDAKDVGGYTYAWLIRTDANGNQLWSKTFGEKIFQRAYSVQQITDGGYVLVGQKGTAREGSSAFIIKVSSDASLNQGITPTITPTPIPTVTPTPISTSTTTPTSTITPIVTPPVAPTPTPQSAGFEAILVAFGITTALALRRR